MYSKVREKSRSKSKSKTQKQQTTESTKVIHTVPQGEEERNGVNVQIPVEVIAECQSKEAIQKSGSKTRSDSKVTRNRSSSRKEKKRNNKATSSSSSNSSEIESVPIAAPRTLRSKSVGKNIRHSGTPPPRRGGRFTDTSFAYSVNNHGDTAEGGKRGDRNKKYEMEHFSRTEVENVYASPDEVVYEVPVIQTKPIKGILKNWNTDIHQVHGFKYPSLIPSTRFHYNDESFYNVDINNASALAYKPSSNNIKQQNNDWRSHFAYMHPAHSSRRSRSQSRGAESREYVENAKDEWHNYSFPKKTEKYNKMSDSLSSNKICEREASIQRDRGRLYRPVCEFDEDFDSSAFMARSWTLPEAGGVPEMNDISSEIVMENVGQTKIPQLLKVEQPAQEIAVFSKDYSDSIFETSKWISTNSAMKPDESIISQSKKKTSKISGDCKDHEKVFEEQIAHVESEIKSSENSNCEKHNAVIGLEDHASSSSWQSATTSSDSSPSVKDDLKYKIGSNNAQVECSNGELPLTNENSAIESTSNFGMNYVDFASKETNSSKQQKQGGFDQNLSGGGESSGAGGGIPYLDSTKHICFMSGEEGGADCNYMDKISINHAEMDGTQMGLCNGTHEEEKKDTINVKNSTMISSAPYTRHRLYKNYEEEESFEI